MPLTRGLGEQVAALLTKRGCDTSALTDLYRNDFEAWLTQLAEGRPWTSEADHLRDRAWFLEASTLIGEILRHSQRTAFDRPPWLSRLVTFWHQNRSIVLTLNYDTLIEEAVQRLHLRRVGQLVHYSQVYAVPITSANARRGGMFAADPAQTFRLLKLHGSLNWWYSGADSSQGETLYDGGLTQSWDSEYIEVVGDRDTSMVVDKVPYIVPPTGAKTSFFNNETIRAQWRVAEKFLRGGQLVIMGYSLPEADRLMRRFLSDAPLMPPVEITLVDCNPEIAEHFRESLPNFTFNNIWCGTPDAIERFANELQVSDVENPDDLEIDPFGS
jgi:hypothetical protein